LKPLKLNDLKSALDKYKLHFKTESNDTKVKLLHDTYQKIHQKRLLIRYGQTIKAIDLSDAAYFYTKQKTSFMCLNNADIIPVDEALDELERILDAKRFFRINRQFIVSFNAIDSMFSSTKSRVKIILKPTCEEETIVSAERASDFKHWLLGVE
jgi:DNA-binding LytR/AlgR family response regulator